MIGLASRLKICASQKNCDGEEYDLMVEAANKLIELEKRLSSLLTFESKFGVSEIVVYQPHERHGTYIDELLEVQAITFGTDKVPEYLCRYPRHGTTVYFKEHQLLGDPDFDHHTGYPKGE